METVNLILPAYWASALVNADYTGMEDHEIAELETWQDNNTYNSPLAVSAESEFVAYHDAPGVLPADCLTYTFEAIEDKAGFLHLT